MIGAEVREGLGSYRRGFLVRRMNTRRQLRGAFGEIEYPTADPFLSISACAYTLCRVEMYIESETTFIILTMQRRFKAQTPNLQVSNTRLPYTTCT